MLADAAPEQVACWQSVPEDGQWYQLRRPEVEPSTTVWETSWPHLSGGPKYWRTLMAEPAAAFGRLLRAFGADTICDRCAGSGNSNFDSHCVGSPHFYMVSKTVEENKDSARERLWQEICVVGGIIRYNHLDGEVQAMRMRNEITVPAMTLQDVPGTGQWVLVGEPACVATRPPGEKDQWPNLWSVRHWKEKMSTPAIRIEKILQSIGGSCSSFTCMCCEGQYMSSGHLLGPKHYSEIVVKRIAGGEPGPVRVDDFWQTWTFNDGAVAYNHIDGMVRMVRRPLLLEDQAETPGTSEMPALTADPEPAPAAVVPRAVAAKSPMLVAPVAMPTPQTSMPQVSVAPAMPRAPKAPPTPPPQPAMRSCDTSANAFCWFWQHVAGQRAAELEAAVLNRGGFGQCRPVFSCAICERQPSEGLGEHIARDEGHLERVQALFAAEGPDSARWTQVWPGLGRAHHLTWSFELLDINTGMQAPANAAPASATAVASMPSPPHLPVTPQPDPAVTQVAAAASAPALSPLKPPMRGSVAQAAAQGKASAGASTPKAVVPSMSTLPPSGPVTRSDMSSAKGVDPWMEKDPWGWSSQPRRPAAATPQEAPPQVITVEEKVSAEPAVSVGTAVSEQPHAPGEPVVQEESSEASEWQAFSDPGSGKVWYYNARTGEASWDASVAVSKVPSADAVRRQAEIHRLAYGDADSDSLSERSRASRDGGALWS